MNRTTITMPQNVQDLTEGPCIVLSNLSVRLDWSRQEGVAGRVFSHTISYDGGTKGNMIQDCEV